MQHGGRSGVAGNHQRLDPTGDQPVEALERELANLGDGARSVRLPGGVPQIEDPLVRKLVQHSPRDSESAEAAVEDPDR